MSSALASHLEATPIMREVDILNYLVMGEAPGTVSEAESNQLTQAQRRQVHAPSQCQRHA